MSVTKDADVNLGIRQRNLRLIFGLSLIVIATLIIVSLLSIVNSGWWYLLLFILSFQGFRFVYDYHTGTCPVMSELGQENRSALFSVTGEKIEDESRAAAIKKKSRIAIVKSVLLAGFLTVVGYYLTV